jgi:spermidine/putrescine transport system permease protein
MTSTVGTPPRPAAEAARVGTVDGSSRKRARPRLPKFGLALPASLWWVVFFVVPVVLVIAASFGSKVPQSAGRVSYSDISLDNYREALDGGLGGTFFKVLVQGMRTTVLGTALCLMIAFPLAYLLAIKVRRGKGLVLALLAIPFFTNFLIRTLAWRIVLAPKGLISNTLLDWGLINQRLNLLDSRSSATNSGKIINGR